MRENGDIEARFDHPRPQRVREGWASLDAPFGFALDRDARFTRPDQVAFDAAIRVPFAPETRASGVAYQGRSLAFWYQRRVEVPPLEPGERFLLCFEAVDHEATVWIDGVPAAHHEGGYTPFAVDLSEHTAGGTACEITVRAFDDPDDLSKPRGKQEWRDEPHLVFYPRTSGIWRTVWTERAPARAIEEVAWSASVAQFGVGLEVRVRAPGGATDLALEVRLRHGGRLLADERFGVQGPWVRRFVPLRQGFDAALELLWSPEAPRLLDAELVLRDGRGRVHDRVHSYTALRTLACEGDALLLNDRPVFVRAVLDQGYWPDTGLTPPDPAALRRDVELAKALGMNAVRKHQKREDPRYLAWADRLGLLVFCELPSAFAFDPTAVRRGLAEWAEIVRLDRSHPSVAGWVCVNESWGTPGLPERRDVQDYVRALVAVAHAMDGTRPVVSNDGWEVLGGDLVAIHDYDQDPVRLAARYRDRAALAEHLRGFAPVAGPGVRRRTLLDGAAPDTRPVLVSEFGGIGLDDRPGTWGYSAVASADLLVERYGQLCAALGSSSALSGFCYTQLTDTYQETNGLLRMDRTPKAPLEKLLLATLGLGAGGNPERGSSGSP